MIGNIKSKIDKHIIWIDKIPASVYEHICYLGGIFV
jgi:hypothetical protein